MKKGIKINFFNFIIPFIMVIILTPYLFSQTDDSLYYTNPGLKVASELFNRRVVMLGDYDHHQPGPYKRVYNVLDNWLKICETKDEPLNLTYIIENDENTADELNIYLTTGDIAPVISKIGTAAYLQDLEYFKQLRIFSLRIDTINQYRIKKIKFKIKGFEEVGCNYEKVARLTKRENELWFVNERDTMTAEGIIKYMRANPTEQILIFYGTAHLQDGYISKNFGFNDLTEKECMGYYLVHYLKKYFGNEKVLTFNTHYYYEGLIQDAEFNSIKDKDFITKPINFIDPASVLSTSDYVFVCHSKSELFIQLGLICSNIILKNAIFKINEAKKWLPGYSASNIYYSNLYNIYYLTGKILKAILH